MAFMDNDALQRFVEDAEPEISGKAALSHFHTEANGVMILLSDSTPTDDDEGILTLVVSASALPNVGCSISELIDGYGSNVVPGTSVSNRPHVILKYKAYLNGEAVDAMYRVSGSYYLFQDWSTAESCELGMLVSTMTVNVRVRASGIEKSFSFTTSLVASEYCPTKDTGVYRAGELLPYADDIGGQFVPYDDSENLSIRYYFEDGVTDSDFQTMRLTRLTGADTTKLNGTIQGYDEAYQQTYEGVGVFSPGDGYIEAPITETFSAEDVDATREYLVWLETTSGLVLMTAPHFKVEEAPATDHFTNHWSRLAFNVSAVYGNTENENTATPYTYGYKTVYLFFEFSERIGYDLNVTVQDRSKVMITSNDGVSEFTIPANTKRYRTSFRLPAGTAAGTYYYVLSIEGGGYEQLRTIDFVVT